MTRQMRLLFEKLLLCVANWLCSCRTTGEATGIKKVQRPSPDAQDSSCGVQRSTVEIYNTFGWYDLFSTWKSPTDFSGIRHWANNQSLGEPSSVLPGGRYRDIFSHTLSSWIVSACCTRTVRNSALERTEECLVGTRTLIKSVDNFYISYVCLKTRIKSRVQRFLSSYTNGMSARPFPCCPIRPSRCRKIYSRHLPIFHG